MTALMGIVRNQSLQDEGRVAIEASAKQPGDDASIVNVDGYDLGFLARNARPERPPVVVTTRGAKSRLSIARLTKG